MPRFNTNQLIDDLLKERREAGVDDWFGNALLYESAQQAPVYEDPDVAYRNKIIDGIENLAESIRQNLTKLGVDSSHYYVTQLIAAENTLRELNEDICAYCDAANNAAIEDTEKFGTPEDQLGDFSEFETTPTGDT